MTNANFNSDISFVINAPMDGNLIPIAQQEGFQIQLHQKNQNQNSEWERCDGDLMFTKG